MFGIEDFGENLLGRKNNFQFLYKYKEIKKNSGL
jgi:hypothetical protein